MGISQAADAYARIMSRGGPDAPVQPVQVATEISGVVGIVQRAEWQRAAVSTAEPLGATALTGFEQVNPTVGSGETHPEDDHECDDGDRIVRSID